MSIKIYNTATKLKEEFKPINPKEIKIYNCGPTVYSFQHIGNMYSSVFADVLRRVLEYIYTDSKVTQVMNITDVGHLVSDEDAGEDKMEKGAKKSGKTVWEVAEFFTNQFLTDVKRLNVQEPSARPRATDFIQQIIDLNKILLQKGFAYETDEAVYFDVTKFPEYGKLSGQKLEDKLKGVREDVYVDKKKKNPADFALWFKRVGRFSDHSMHWDSPWGDGFPGWHIECSAMSKSYLGEQIDIHTGGVEHIPVHHTNEIAQSEGASGHKFVNYWMHHQLILVDGQKMSKSLGNTYMISDLEEKGFEPLSLRLLYLQNKYRDQLNFTFNSLESAQISLKNIRKQIRDLKTDLQNQEITAEKKENKYQENFENAISDDLNIPVALSVLHKLLKDNSIDKKEKLEQILSFDKVFGLELDKIESFVETEEIKELKEKWNKAREEKNWEIADKLREEIENLTK